MQENVEKNEKNENVKGGLMVVDNKVEENVTIKTTLDLNNEDDVDLIINNVNGQCDHLLIDFVDKEINVVNVYTTTRKEEVYDDDTGELVNRYNHVTILFDDNNESYVSGSNAVYRSLNTILMFKGLPSKENPIKMKAIRVDAKEKGHQYLQLTIAKQK